jgi:hypothetical protein
VPAAATIERVATPATHKDIRARPGHAPMRSAPAAILAYQPSRRAVVALVVTEGGVDDIAAARRRFEALDDGRG